MLNKKPFIIILLLLVVNNLFAYDFELNGIKTDENTITTYRGKSMQTVSNDNYLISMFAMKTSDGIQFLTSITNYSSKDYFFKENCITVYQGIYEENNWQKIEYVPASKYFEEEKKDAKTEEIWSAVALGIAAAGAGYSTVNGTGYVNGYRYTYQANVYSPADAAIATASSYMALDNLQKNNQNYLENLENNLLFDSLILANENYNGFFIIDEKKGPDYKVVFDLSSEEKFCFYFTRSDKEEILNPWKDKSHDRHSIVAGISPTFNHFNISYLWSRSKGVGVYGGFSYRYESKNINAITETYIRTNSSISGYDLEYPDPLGYGYSSFYDWKFDYDTTNYYYNSFGLCGGLTIKTFPYTWILAGLGLEMIDGRYYKGNIYYCYNDLSGNVSKDYYYYKSGWIKDKSFELLFAPQIGINFISNHLDIGCMASFPIKGKFSIDVIAGFAF